MFFIFKFILTRIKSTLAHSEDPDDMLRKVAFYWFCTAKLKTDIITLSS